MRAIKAVVIGMGLLILAGFVIVGVTLVMRMQEVGTPEGAFQSLATLPAGARIVETQITDERIVLRLETAAGGQSLLILNAKDGREIGRIALAVEGR